MNMISPATVSPRRGHRTYPIGLDVEACTFKVLKKAWKEAKEPQHREHAMPYFYEGVQLINSVNRQLQTGIPHADSTSPSSITPPTSAITAGRWIRPKIWNSCEKFMLASMGAMISHGKKFWTWFTTTLNLMKINAGVQHKTLKDIDKRALKRK
jgi:hypothetical protein